MCCTNQRGDNANMWQHRIWDDESCSFSCPRSQLVLILRKRVLLGRLDRRWLLQPSILANACVCQRFMRLTKQCVDAEHATCVGCWTIGFARSSGTPQLSECRETERDNRERIRDTETDRMSVPCLMAWRSVSIDGMFTWDDATFRRPLLWISGARLQHRCLNWNAGPAESKINSYDHFRECHK